MMKRFHGIKMSTLNSVGVENRGFEEMGQYLYLLHREVGLKMLSEFYDDCCKRDVNIYNLIPLLHKDLVIRSFSGFSFVFLQNDGPPLCFFHNYKGRIVHAELNFQLLITVEMLRSGPVDFAIIVYLADLKNLQFRFIGCVGKGFSNKEDIKFDMNFDLNILLVMNRNTPLISFWKLPIISNKDPRNMYFLGGHSIGCISLPVLSLSSRGQFIAIQGNSNGYIFSFATISPGPNPGSDAISKLKFPSTIDSVPSHQSELEDFEECTLFNHYTHFLPNATVLQEPFSYPAVTVRRKRLLNTDSTSRGASSHVSCNDASNDNNQEIQEYVSDTLEYISELSLLLSFCSLAPATSTASYSDSATQGRHGKKLVSLYFLNTMDHSNGNDVSNISSVSVSGSEGIPSEGVASQRLVVVERGRVHIFVICKIAPPPPTSPRSHTRGHSHSLPRQPLPAEFAFIRMTEFSLPRPAIAAARDVLPYLPDPWTDGTAAATSTGGVGSACIGDERLTRSLSRHLGCGSTLYLRTTENRIDEWLLPYSEIIPCCHFISFPDTEKDMISSCSNYSSNTPRNVSNTTSSRMKPMKMTCALVSSTSSTLFYDSNSPSDRISGSHFPTLLNRIPLTNVVVTRDINSVSRFVVSDLRLIVSVGLRSGAEKELLSSTDSSGCEQDLTHVLLFDRSDILSVVDHILEVPWEVVPHEQLVHNQESRNPTTSSNLNGFRNNRSMLINIFHRLKDFVTSVVDPAQASTCVEVGTAAIAVLLLRRIAAKMSQITEIGISLGDHKDGRDAVVLTNNNSIAAFWSANSKNLSIHEIIQNFASALKNLCHSQKITLTTTTAADDDAAAGSRSREIADRMKVLCHNTNILIRCSSQQLPSQTPHSPSTSHQLDNSRHLTTDIYQSKYCFDDSHIAYDNDIYLLEIIAFLYLKSILICHGKSGSHNHPDTAATATGNIRNTFATSLLELGCELKLDWSHSPMSLCFMWSFIEESPDMDHSLREAWQWLLARAAVMTVNSRKFSELSVNSSKEFIDESSSSSEEYSLLDLFFDIAGKENSLDKLLQLLVSPQPAMFELSLIPMRRYLVSSSEAVAVIHRMAATVSAAATTQLAESRPCRLPSLLRNMFQTYSRPPGDHYLVGFLKDLFLVPWISGPVDLMNLLRHDIFLMLTKEVSAVLPTGTPDCASPPFTASIELNNLFWRYLSMFLGMMLSMQTVGGDVDHGSGVDVLSSTAIATEHLRLLCKEAVQEFQAVCTTLSAEALSFPSTIQFSKGMSFRREVENLCVSAPAPAPPVLGVGNSRESSRGTTEGVDRQRRSDEVAVDAIDGNNEFKVEIEEKATISHNFSSFSVGTPNIVLIDSLLSMLDSYGKFLSSSSLGSSGGVVNGNDRYGVKIFEESQSRQLKQHHDCEEEKEEKNGTDQKKHVVVAALDDHLCLSFILSVFQIVHPLLRCIINSGFSSNYDAIRNPYPSFLPSLVKNTNMDDPKHTLNLNTLFDITVARHFPRLSTPISNHDTSVRSMSLRGALGLLHRVREFRGGTGECDWSGAGGERQRLLRVHVWHTSYLFVHQTLVDCAALDSSISCYVHLVCLYALLCQTESERHHSSENNINNIDTKDNNHTYNPISQQAAHSTNNHTTNYHFTQQAPTPHLSSASLEKKREVERVWLLQRFETFLTVLAELLETNFHDAMSEDIVSLIVSVSLDVTVAVAVATSFSHRLSSDVDESSIRMTDQQPKDYLELWKSIVSILSSKICPSDIIRIAGPAAVYKEALRMFILISKSLHFFDNFIEIFDILPDAWDGAFLYA